MRIIRFIGLVTASAVALGAWTGSAGALVDNESTTAADTTVAASPELDVRVPEYLAGVLRVVPTMSVRVTPGGDVSAPSLTGGVIAPPPPPPIVRDALYRVARTVGLEGEVEITISRHGGDVSAPSLTGGVIAPPPPPPIVRELLEQVDRRLSVDKPGSFAVIELRNLGGKSVAYQGPSL